MADTTTTNLLLTNQENGGNENTWGDKADANFEQLDDVLGDQTSIGTTGGNTNLTNEQELVAIIETTGTLVSNATITFSGRGGFWVISNLTTGSFTVTCLVSGETGVVIPQGTRRVVYCDGTDIRLVEETSITAEETVASAATADVLGTSSDFVAISGTATITSLGTGATRRRFVRATGAFTLTHNATSLIMPDGQNRTVSAGDTFIVVADASSNVRIHAYQPASGAPYDVTRGIQTGFPLWLLQSGTLSGFVRMNGRTIGSAGSGSTERANADVEALYTYLWNNLSNNVCAVTGGRGVSAAADWAADKPMATPDMRGKGPFGVDTMGAAAGAGVITDATVTGGDGDSDTPGGSGGAEDHTLVESETPAHDHGGATGSAGAKNTTITAPIVNVQVEAGATRQAAQTVTNTVYATASAHTHSISSFGGGQAHNNMPPFMLGTWYLKL